ncbi:MAG: SUMF1/EgtB/PvdO family nonheme iron enzyme [Lewinellaceae bacterium]|nr:SUMF1/EgtB/PvdO family nonheme iron enzyme [Lewinellaceae bacterium]
MPLRNHLFLVLPFLLLTAHATKEETPSTFRPGKDFALFFAVSNYDQWDKLQNPVKDAEAIAGDLNKYYAFDTMVVRNPTYDKIIEVLNRYTERTYADDGQLFVFFTGHGYLSTAKEGFFVPKDGKNDVSQRSYLAHNRVAYLINNIPCKHILLGIDACYSGSFMRTIQQKGDIGKRPGETSTAVKERFIQDMLQYKSRLVITSGGEEPTNDKSQFARQILAALRSRGGNGGIPDASDACPQEYGTANARGCPDADDDGVPDQSDRCKYVAGLARWQGCPDTDGDGVPDHEDKCPSEKGEIALEGCPRADNMILVRGGTFQMGSNDGEADEKPVHSVTVSDFYLGKYEVTAAEFKAFVDATGYQPDADKWGNSWVYTDTCKQQRGVNWKYETRGNLRPSSEYNHPVIHVSWNDATAYCEWLSKKSGLKYRLPTEAEWEYAAGGGSTGRTKWSGTSNENDLINYANNAGNKDGFATTAPVGSLQANTLGLHDMSGNVYEWCSDWKDTYPSSAQTNPVGPSSGSYRVIRGGSWVNDPQVCRVANRGNFKPDARFNFVGFRLARTR